MERAWRKLVFPLLILILLLVLAACTEIGDGTTGTPNGTNGNGTAGTTQQPTTGMAEHSHSFGEWVVVAEASCVEDGLKERTCSCGEKETEVVAKAEHSYSDDVTNPTCTDEGYTTHTCSYCGDSYVDSYVDALGHKDEDKNHQCDNSCGEFIGTCEDLNYDHKCDYGCDKSFGTCEDNDKDHHCDYGCDKFFGTHADTDKDHDCDYCGAKVSEHNYSTVTIVPTCTERGYTICFCLHCGDSYVDNYVDAHGHKDENKDHACDYNCGENIGLCADENHDHKCDYGCDKFFGTHADTDKDHNCDYCGAKVSEHSYSAVVTSPTCTARGYTTHTCFCGDVYVDTYVDAVGHDTVHHDKKAPTCGEKGWEAYDTCTRCDYTTYVELAATEQHKYVNGACEVCGKEQPESEGLEFVLNSDGKSYTVAGVGTCADADVRIPSVYNGLPVTAIGRSAFSNCKSLTSIVIPNSVTSIERSVFFYCSALTSITVAEGNSIYHSAGNCVIETASKTLVFGCGKSVIPIDGSVTSIDEWAFSGCDSLISITIPGSITSIGSCAFAGCDSLTSVIIEDGVTSIGNEAFEYCISLTSVTIPDSVTSIGDSAFSFCSGLTSIAIPDSVTSISSYAFHGCSGLMSITIPASVTSIGDSAFLNCSSLTSITIPDSVTSIGWGVFYGCSGLTSITIPDSVTSIGWYAFYGCSSLVGITVAEGNSIYHSAGNCVIETATKTLIIGCQNSVIPDDGSVTSIGDFAFSGCSSLATIVIPDSVTSIGEWAFDGCSGLTDIYFDGTCTQWNVVEKKDSWNKNTGNYIIHCTDGDISK